MHQVFPHEYKRALLESQAVSNATIQEKKNLDAMKGQDAFEMLKSMATTSGGFSKANPPPALRTPAESISPQVSMINIKCLHFWTVL